MRIESSIADEIIKMLKGRKIKDAIDKLEGLKCKHHIPLPYNVTHASGYGLKKNKTYKRCSICDEIYEEIKPKSWRA